MSDVLSILLLDGVALRPQDLEGHKFLTFFKKQNDDGTTFSQDDATKLTNWGHSVGLFQISYWAAQRDQVGDASLDTHSMVNKTDYEFYQIFTRTNYM